MSNYWRLRGFDSTHSEAPFCGPRPKEKIEESQIEEKSEKAKEVSENLTDKTGKLKQCNFYALSEWFFVVWFVWVPGEQRKAKNTHQCEWLVFTRGACLHITALKWQGSWFQQLLRHGSRVTGPCACFVAMSKALHILLDYVYKGFGGAQSSVIYHNMNISDHLSTLQLVRQ